MGNILVTGAGGQLGNELRLLTKGRKRFIFTDAVPCDGAEVLISAIRVRLRLSLRPTASVP